MRAREERIHAHAILRSKRFEGVTHQFVSDEDFALLIR